jgi:putative peptidoglycan lipid II flippase
MRIISLVMAISGAVIFITAPFIATVVMDGAKPNEIAALALVIAMFILCLVPFGILFVIQRTYFAFDDTKTPFYFTLIQVTLYAGGSLIVLVTTPTELVAAMIALSYSISTFIQVFVALLFLSKKLGGIDGKRVFVSHLKFLIALIPTLLLGFALLQFTIDFIDEENLVLAIVESLVYASLMSLTYLGTLLLLKSEELGELLLLIKKKMGR